MDALTTGTVKQRLEEEFPKIGFKDKLQMTIVYDDTNDLPLQHFF